MSRLHDLPIRRKLLLLTMTSTGAALAFATIGFLAWDVVQFRDGILKDLQGQATLIAENSGAPLAFGDDRVADEILAVLAIRTQVDVACLYDRSGAVFASYGRGPGSVCPQRPPTQSTAGWQSLEVVESVKLDRQVAGTLYIRRSLEDLYDRLRVGAGLVLVLLLLAIAAAFVTARRFQRLIATPLLELADTARAISATRNYSLRATRTSSDEIGVVMQSFNEMLDRIAEALERERTANRLKDEFLATLSHELRTPLSSVLGWARMLRSGRLDAAVQAQALTAIERNARAQSRLIEDLLDMSWLASGRPRVSVHEADFASIVDAAVEGIRPAAAAKRLRLTVEIAQRPAITQGDPGRLQQIVWNLLSNAVKFTPVEGEIWIRLEREDGYTLSIRDSGPGIDPAFLPFIFEPFRQADGSTTRAYGGLGLGLAIAKQLVELHGGTIQAHSDGRGTGATFEVRLPSVVPTPAAAAVPPPIELPVSAVDSSLLKDVHVLVVDDEPDARVLLEAALSQYGARVTTAASAAEALAEIDRQPPHVLLSDLGMPNQDGHELIRLVRDRPADRGGAVPAVAVTAFASAKDGLLAKASGFQAHIAKPFESEDVANLIALLAGVAESGHQHTSASDRPLHSRNASSGSTRDTRRAGT